MSQAFESSIDKRYKALKEQARILVQNGPNLKERLLATRFDRYCKKAAQRAKGSAKKHGLPFDIDAQYISKLMADQKYACFLTGAKFRYLGKIDPFGPSLDRIVPSNGYVRGNVRVVCHMANIAMSNWGEMNLNIFFNCWANKLQHSRLTDVDALIEEYQLDP